MRVNHAENTWYILSGAALCVAPLNGGLSRRRPRGAIDVGLGRLTWEEN